VIRASAGGASAEFRFYEELNDFLAPERRKNVFQVPIDRGRSVKDAIESVGVPHTEVDLVLVDGASVAFGHVLRGGERVAVYPVFERARFAPSWRLRPSPLRETRFVLDCHLGKLARHLRMAGFDSLWETDYGDEEIVALSAAQKRVILTRDKGLLQAPRGSSAGTTCAKRIRRNSSAKSCVHSNSSACLKPSPAAGCATRRCANCPGSPSTGACRKRCGGRRKPFTDCPNCGRIFWRGTHYERLARILPCGQRGQLLLTDQICQRSFPAKIGIESLTEASAVRGRNSFPAGLPTPLPSTRRADRARRRRSRKIRRACLRTARAPTPAAHSAAKGGAAAAQEGALVHEVERWGEIGIKEIREANEVGERSQGPLRTFHRRGGKVDRERLEPRLGKGAHLVARAAARNQNPLSARLGSEEFSSASGRGRQSPRREIFREKRFSQNSGCAASSRGIGFKPLIHTTCFKVCTTSARSV